jgi:hypothetical protein
VLLLLYINYLDSYIEHGRPTFFADDTSIFIAGSSDNNVQSKINEMINKFIEWFQRNRLVINKVKTIAISFHQPQKVHFECPSINIYDRDIKNSEQLKFLGVWLDTNLSWSTHTQNLAKKT